ncbi:hypothetical protein BDZ45DRAFT_739156 [Acephala macrosclerotiorum]|nr:hypothetical protein BDZ45DRAFT_739156 [Acephala macrosclerotiorum]
MASASWDPIVMKDSMMGLEASRPTISPVLIHDTPWTFGLEGHNTGRDSDFCVSIVEEPKPATTFVGQYLTIGAHSEDVGWPTGTAIDPTQSPLNCSHPQKQSGNGEPFPVHPSSTPSTSRAPSSDLHSQSAPPRLGASLEPPPCVDPLKRTLAKQRPVSQFSGGKPSKNAYASPSRLSFTPRELMVAEASGLFQTGDCELTSPSGDQISGLSFPSRVFQDISRRQQHVRDAINVPLNSQHQKRRPARENNSFSSPGFTGSSVRLANSFGTPASSQRAAPASSRDCSGSGTFSSPSGAPSTPLGKAPGLGPRIYNEAGGLEESAVAVESSTGSESRPRALPMICWHKANGTDCKGKTGQNAKCKNLIRDHSMSLNTKNPTNKKKRDSTNHHTYWPCRRCPLLFDSEEALTNHQDEDPLCIDLLPHGSRPASEETRQTGASPDRMHEIKRAMEAYGNSRTLPPECKEKGLELQDWVARNSDKYRGQSNETIETANTELGKWFIGWYMFFPQTVIPDNPFVGCSRKKRRALQLLKDYLEADATSGKIDRLEAAALTRVLYRAEAAMDLAEEEEAKRENEARGSKKRKSGGGNATDSFLSPAPVAQLDSSPPVQIHSTAASDRPRLGSIGQLVTTPDVFSDARRLSQLKEGSEPSFSYPSKRRITSAPSQLGSSPSREIGSGVSGDESNLTNISQYPGTEVGSWPQAAQPVDLQPANSSEMPPASNPFSASNSVAREDGMEVEELPDLPDGWEFVKGNFDIDYPWDGGES